MNWNLILLVLICNVQIFAQKIKLEKNNLLVDNENWGSLSEIRSKSGHNTLVFYGTDGKIWFEALYVSKKSDDTIVKLYQINFLPQNRIVYYKEGMELKKSLSIQLVKSGAITKTGTYDRGIDKFERNFGTVLSEITTTKIDHDKKIKKYIVERNKNAPIFLANGFIKQDFKIIGKYNEQILSNEDSSLVKVHFYNIQGIEIANANFYKTSAETAYLSINGLEEVLTINLNPGNNTLKIIEIIKQLIYLGIL